jgi:hypothetical protein
MQRGLDVWSWSHDRRKGVDPAVLTSCHRGRNLKIGRLFFEINELEGDVDLIFVGLWEQQINGSLP